jgi:hypothetical protein
MRIGTWNVAYAAGREKNERRLRRIVEMDCDIWVLMETHDDLALDSTYGSTSTTPRKTAAVGGRWTTIWSRFPILQVVPVEDSHRTAAVLVESPSGPLVVFGTVLPWHTDPGPSGTARAWTEHHRVIPLQAREWAALRTAYPDAALCVAGDLNMNLGGPHYYGTVAGRAALRAGLAGAGLSCVTETERIPPGMLAHGPIDHVCVSEGLGNAVTRVMAWEGTDGDGARISDHSGVAVESE